MSAAAEGPQVQQSDGGFRLHVACGEMCEPGYLGMDVEGLDTDLTHDAAQFPWPLATSSVSEVLCAGYAHRTWPVGGSADGLIRLMNEIHRVLKPAGTARIVHPYARSDRALQDPTATRLISDQTWWFFDAAWREREGMHRPAVTADFEVVALDAPLHLDWYQRAPAAQAFAQSHYWNVVGDLEVLLRARKASVEVRCRRGADAER